MATPMKKKAEATGSGLCYDAGAAVRHLAKADPVLAKLMKRAGPFALKTRHMHNPFEALARNIVFQQLHGVRRNFFRHHNLHSCRFAPNLRCLAGVMSLPPKS